MVSIHLQNHILIEILNPLNGAPRLKWRAGYPIPASLSSTDIRAAAAAAAQARIVRAPQESEETVNPDDGGQGLSERREEYIDEDELLNMPNLLDEMARGMQVSPLRITSYSSDDSPGNSDGDNLWSYTL